MSLPILELIRLLASPAGTQDVYFEQLTVTSTEGATPGSGLVSRVWATGRDLRMEVGPAGGPALVLLLDAGRAWRLDPAQKIAERIDLGRLRARSHADASVAGDLMGATEEDSVRTRALGTSRTVAGHACADYRIEGPLLRMDVCVSRGIPLGVDAFADFLEWSGAEQSLRGILAEVRRLPGFPLETRARVDVLGRRHETRATITKIRLGPQPRELFEPPPGYRIVGDGSED